LRRRPAPRGRTHQFIAGAVNGDASSTPIVMSDNRWENSMPLRGGLQRNLFRWRLAPRAKPLAQEIKVGRIFLPMSASLHPPEHPRRCERDRYTVDLQDHHIARRLGVVDRAGGLH